jgi:hypothetical protein
MPSSDFHADKAAVAPLVNRRPSGPTISALNTALQANNGTYWTTKRLNDSTKQDLIYAARLAGLSVAGL